MRKIEKIGGHMEQNEEIERLQKENSNLRAELNVECKDGEYQCKHVAEDSIDASCVWCNLTVAEKGLAKQKELRLELQQELATLKAELATIRAILDNPEKWMKWCDIKVLEENEKLEAELDWWRNLIRKHHDNKKCPDLKTYVENLQQENAKLKEEVETVRLESYGEALKNKRPRELLSEERLKKIKVTELPEEECKCENPAIAPELVCLEDGRVINFLGNQCICCKGIIKKLLKPKKKLEKLEMRPVDAKEHIDIVNKINEIIEHLTKLEERILLAKKGDKWIAKSVDIK